VNKRLWHLPSSLRFLVVPVASCGWLMQPDWLHHRSAWCNGMMTSQVTQGAWVPVAPDSHWVATLRCR
jgi:hypothetical protein